MARVLVLDVEKNEVRVAECNGIDDFYRELNAEPFDIATRRIDGRAFDIFVDDMGLLRDPEFITVSAVNGEGEPMLVGNLVFANHDSEGNTTDLDDADIEHIKNNIMIAFSRKHPGGYKILTHCEYA